MVVFIKKKNLTGRSGNSDVEKSQKKKMKQE